MNINTILMRGFFVYLILHMGHDMANYCEKRRLTDKFIICYKLAFFIFTDTVDFSTVMFKIR